MWSRNVDKEQTELFHGIVVSIPLYYYFTIFANEYDLIEEREREREKILEERDNGLAGKFIIGTINCTKAEKFITWAIL